MTAKKKKAVTPPERVEISRHRWEQWRDARARAQEWDERAQRLRQMLEEEIGDSPLATVNGIPVISWKTTEKRNVFDAKAHAANEPACHAAYMVKKDGTRPFNEMDFDEDLLEGDDD